MRRLLGPAVCLTAFLALSPWGGAVAAAPSLAGTYRCQGVNPDGSKYQFKVIITHKGGDEYHLKWDDKEQDEGNGTLIGQELVVTYKGKDGRGKVVYKLRGDGTLVGSWKPAGSKKEGTETLTPVRK